jgi:hypothetical protein
MRLAVLMSPWVLAAAALAVLLLWLARRGLEREAWWSSTLDLLRPLARPPQASRGARRRPPPDVACAAAALLAAGLALGWPRDVVERGPRQWTVQVDASPSLFLPWVADGEVPLPDAPTRLERALERTAAELERVTSGDDRLLWRRVVDGRVQVHEGRACPPPWREPPAVPQDPPSWEALDLPGHLWVSDDLSGPAPSRARAILSGGSAVPGPVVALGRGRLTGTPGGLQVDAVAHPPPRMALQGMVASGALARVLEAWRAARGVELESGPPAELVLALAPAQAAGEVSRRVAGQGWTWEFSPASGRPQGTPWLADEHGTLVAWTAGRIELAGLPTGEPQGDPAAFAASWSHLLDAASLPPAGVVSTAERAAAGAPRVLGPDPAEAQATGRPPARAPALLALLASCLAATALALSRPR